MSESQAATVENYLSAEELAERLSVSVSTVQRWSRSGKLPRAVRLSRRVVRWREAEVAARIERTTQREPAQ